MPRELHAPTGSKLNCKGWHQEAAYRMLQNNLDPNVAEDPDDLIVYGGSSWAGPSAQNVALLGINTTADSTNKLSVASAAVLFNNVGNGIQTKLNKAAAGDTASFLFQTNWSGRAEIGCIGDDNFSFKVSADGSAWSTGLVLVPGAGGVPRVPSFTVAGLPSRQRTSWKSARMSSNWSRSASPDRLTTS